MEKNKFRKLFQNYFAEKYPINNFPREILDIISNYHFQNIIPEGLFDENDKDFYRTFLVKNENEKEKLRICFKKIFKNKLISVPDGWLMGISETDSSIPTNFEDYKVNCFLTTFLKSNFNRCYFDIFGKRTLYSLPNTKDKVHRLYYFHRRSLLKESPSVIYIILTEDEYNVIMNDPQHGYRVRPIKNTYRWNNTDFLEWISKLPTEEITQS